MKMKHYCTDRTCGGEDCSTCYPGREDKPEPEEIIEQLEGNPSQCPGCHGDMKVDADSRMRTGFAWYCPNKDCSERGGCWGVTEFEIRKATR